MASALVLLHSHQQFLLDQAGNVLWTLQAASAVETLGMAPVGRWQNQEVQVYELTLAEEEKRPEQWVSLRQLLQQAHLAPELLGLLRLASQMGTWLAAHRFCGRCGQAMVPVQGERARQCPACQIPCYPQLSPCMIVLITRGDDILLARSPRHPPGIYSVLAGFVEPGETVEQCVVREVLEEVGLHISAPQYVASQNWPFPHALMLGFQAAYVEGEIVPQPGEIEEARWFSIDQLPALPGSHSIARYLIDCYLSQRLGLTPPKRPI